MRRLDLYIYALLIPLLNFPLLYGKFSEPMIFLTHKVLQGQLWRIFTHPFVHVSWYHLLLDSLAFFILYSQLANLSIFKRTAYIAGCGISSLITTVIAMPHIDSIGYCGLSGICHGLMAVCSLNLIADISSERSAKQIGIISLGLLITKCIFETLTGNMLFDFIHGDLIGSPIAIAHAGGLLGGIIVFILLNRKYFAILIRSLTVQRRN